MVNKNFIRMNKIQKNLKTFLILLLFFFSIPNLTFGQWILDELCKHCAGWDLFCKIGCFFNWLFTLIFRLPLAAFAFLGFILALAAIGIGRTAVPYLTNSLIKLSLNPEAYFGVKEGASWLDIFTGTWNTVRVLALSFVRIFLLIIGLMTIFRVREYEARKTLVSLIIAALLVSFSFEIGKKIIEVGNKLTLLVGNMLGVGVGGDYINVENIEQKPKNF
jgi:hypothetical protein